MEQFNLEEYKKNPNRKVVTEHNKEVRIICTDINCAYPIIAAIKINEDRETPLSYDINGKCLFYEGNDLFFADDEKKLSEFEKAMIQFSHERNSLIQFEHTTEEINAHLYLYYKKLLDLARKELQPEFDKEMDKMLAETDKYNRDSIIALIQWSESFNSSGITHDKANQLITWVNSYNPYDIWCHKDSKTFNPTQNQAEFEKGRQDNE